MRAENGELLHAEAASILGWWTLAGVDVAIGEEARDWLAPPAPPPAAVEAAPVADALPPTLAAFEAWIAHEGDPALLGPADRRVATSGPADAELMLLIDMPGVEDAEAGEIVSGPAGRLLDAMLAAIGTTRDAVRIAPLAPCRPAGGRLDAPRIAGLARIARHHVALVGPKRLLLMGRCAAEAILEAGHDTVRGRVHQIDGRPVVATFAPTALLGAPAAMKAGAWDDLRLLLPDTRS